jgi:sodium/proline symporter
MSQLTYAAVFGVYVFGLASLAYYEYRGVDDSSDYMIASGNLRSSFAGISELFSAMSGFWLIGITGLAYVVGTWAWIAIISQVTGWVIMYYGVAERLKRSSTVVGEETLPAYLGTLFSSKLVLFIASIALVVFETVYVSSQITAGATALKPFFDLPWMVAAFIMGAIIVLYTVAGGFQAVAVSDFIQGVLVVLGSFTFVIWTVIQVGGPVELINSLASVDPILVSFTGGNQGFALFASIVFWGFIGMAYFGNPQSLIRFFAIDDSKNVRTAMAWSGGAQLIVAVTAVFIGLTGRVLLEGSSLSNEELVYPVLAINQLPPVAAGFVLAAVIGLLMSTGDSQLLISGTTVSRDLYERLLGNEISDQRSKQIARFSVLALGVVSTIIAALDLSLVLQLVAFAWGGLGATFGPAIFATLWWEHTTSEGVAAGMVVGLVGTILGFTYIGSFHPVLITWNIWPMLLSFVAIYVVSRYTQAQVEQAEHIQELSTREVSAAGNDD